METISIFVKVFKIKHILVLLLLLTNFVSTPFLFGAKTLGNADNLPFLHVSKKIQNHFSIADIFCEEEEGENSEDDLHADFLSESLLYYAHFVSAPALQSSLFLTSIFTVKTPTIPILLFIQIFRI